MLLGMREIAQHVVSANGEDARVRVIAKDMGEVCKACASGLRAAPKQQLASYVPAPLLVAELMDTRCVWSPPMDPPRSPPMEPPS